GPIDNSATPEVVALRSLSAIATDDKEVLLEFEPQRAFEQLKQTPEGEKIVRAFDELLQDYGSISVVGKDDSVHTWLENPGMLKTTGDICFLEFDEVRRLTVGDDSRLIDELDELVESRRSQFVQDGEIIQIPLLVYGNTPPHPLAPSKLYSDQILQGIGASQ